MNKSKMPKVNALSKPGVRSEISPNVLARWNENLKAMDDGGSEENIVSIMTFIGEDYWGDGVSAKRISSQLRQFGEEPVTVQINSPGGNFFDGLAIYNLLRQHKAKVTVQIMGIAASAAAVIAMAGDEVQIARSGFLMIHNTWIIAAGDRNVFLEMAQWLKPFDDASADIFSSRTGIDAAKIATMLDKETWIGGKQAVDENFADDFLSADVIDANPQARHSRPLNAAIRIDNLLARLNVTRSERRDLINAIKKSGMPSAAESTKRSAGVNELEKLTARIDAL